MPYDSADFCSAWDWLTGHPAFIAKGRKAGRKDEPFAGPDNGTFWNAIGMPEITTFDSRVQRFREALDIAVVKVNPETESIDDDETKNTQTRVWLECGPHEDATSPDHQPAIQAGLYPDDWLDNGVPTHDYELDCGGKTFEEAIVTLAKLVMIHYGDYPEEDEVR